jgi:hypothetical protein
MRHERLLRPDDRASVVRVSESARRENADNRITSKIAD